VRVSTWIPGTVDEAQPLTTQTKRVNAVALTPRGDTLFAGSSDGTLVAYDLTVPHWVKSQCRTIGRNLTRTEWRQFLGLHAYQATCADTPLGN
jgi:WD40 repeat protein